MKDLENICLSIDHRGEKGRKPISPEIVQTSSFQFDDYEHYVRVNTGQEDAFTYTRGGNPTLDVLEKKIAQLEGGEGAVAFASGMGAFSATIISLIEKSQHVLIVNTVYGSSVKLIQQLDKLGVESTKIDVSETSEILDYIKDNTKMIYFESPSSQKFELLDLEWISKVARERNIYTVIDNTWATPLIQKPLKYGIDVVIHSCSKYIGGHSDVVGGIVVSRQELIEKINNFGQILLGSTMSPFNAWLLIRGLRTLPVRLKYQDQSIREVTKYLEKSPYVETIYHPLNASQKQKELSKKYLDGMGSLFGFSLKNATPQIIETFVDSLNYFTLAYSWGGFESLVLPAFKGNNEQELKERHLSLGHIRMYIGLEEVELLIEDIDQALKEAYKNKKV